MRLDLADGVLHLHLSGWERLAAVRFSPTLVVPLAHITTTSTEEPPSDWRDLRVPGSFVPGLIKAGTYYTPRGKEFWYVTRKGGGFLRLGLQDEDYQAIVLTLPDNEAWQARLDQARAAAQEATA